MKKHILIAGSILVGVGIMNVIPVKNNEGEILKDDVIVSDVIENKKDDNKIFNSHGKRSRNKTGIIKAVMIMEVNIIPEIFFFPSLSFNFSIILPIHTTGWR